MKLSLAILAVLFLLRTAFATDVQALAEQILYHDNLYWNENRQEISDQEYDLLKQKLQSLSPGHPLLKHIGVTTISGKKIPHSSPVLSLDKAYSDSAFFSWIEKYSRSDDELFIIQPKYDGISISYRDGKMITRGNGYYGTLLTLPVQNVKVLSRRKSFRGELVISQVEFVRLNKARQKGGKERYKTPRTAVVGVVRLLQAGKNISAKLTLIDHEYYSHIATKGDLLDNWKKCLALVGTHDYPVDGAVVTVASQNYLSELGTTQHHPRGAIAYKYTSILKESTILHIEWRCGKSRITPVAVIDTVRFDDVSVSRVALHSYGFVMDNDCMVGDKIIVEYKGGVIPKAIDFVKGSSRQRDDLIQCPSCNEPIEVKGRHAICIGKSCPAVLSIKMVDVLKKNGCRGIGRITMEKIVRLLKLKSVSDLKKLAAKEDVLRQVFSDRTVSALLGSAKKCTDQDFN